MAGGAKVKGIYLHKIDPGMLDKLTIELDTSQFHADSRY